MKTGNSLRTFYSLCGDNEPTIILVKTIKNQVMKAENRIQHPRIFSF